MSRRKPKSTRNSPALTESVGLATIADHLPYHIYLKDRSRRFIWANPAMLKACGCTLEQLKRLRDEDLFEGPHLKEAIADDEIVIKQGAIVLDRLEFETWKPGRGSGTGAATGNVRRLGLVLTTKKPIREGNGKIVGLIGVTRD